ncbi:MAG: alpha/beta hydrolase [Acidimicrobiales bacterium]|nr:alpha/beta hydrolase [Acidimicrobiales bacterium]
MATADLHGTTIWYEIEGDGPPVLVMHGGLGIDHTMYKATLRPLVENHQVIWYDHRNNGGSGRSDPAAMTMEQLADDAAALLAHLGLSPAAVFGHSYGGFVAMELALRHPASVAGLVLVATGPGQLGADEVADEDGVGEPMPDGLLAAFGLPMSTDDEMRDVMRAVLPFYLHRADPGPLIAVLDDTVMSVEGSARGMEILGSWSVVDRLHQIPTPTWVIGGKHDPVMSWPQQVRIAKRIAGARLVVLEDASHFVWLDAPEEFWAAVNS